MAQATDLTLLKPIPWFPGHSLPELLAAADGCHQDDQPLLLAVNRGDGISAPVLTGLARTLSAEEQCRLGGYRRKEDQERFLLGRGMLRQMLALWMDQQPQHVAIALGPQGKPYCRGGPQFNVSHSGDLILLALHRCRPLGVDVEQERPALNWQPIARRLLSSQQVDALLQRPVADQATAFLQAWCHLEAELKAAGWGLAAPPVGGSGGLMCHWRLSLSRGYVGALAAGPASDSSLNG